MQHGLEVTTANPPAFAVPRRAVVARDRLMQLEPSPLFVRTEFVNEREFVAPSRAVQERNSLTGMHAKRVVQHRSHGSDAGSSSDEQQSRLIDGCRKRTGTDRSVDIHEGSRRGPL